MKITEADLQEFIRLYKEEFNEDLPAAEALEMATSLVALYELLSQPLPKEKAGRFRPS